MECSLCRLNRRYNVYSYIKLIFVLNNLKRYDVGQLPRVSGKDPERKEWTQLLKRSLFFVLCLFTCGQIFSFSSFNLLFLYSTVQKSTVQYRYLFGASILQALHDITGQLQYNYNTIQYNTIQYNTIQYNTIVLYCIVVVLELAGNVM